MGRGEAMGRLRLLAEERAFGWHVGSDRLIQAGLDALLADVASPSLASLAGLGVREEHLAGELFDDVVGELGLGFEVPGDPGAARWALAHWLAGRMVDGELSPGHGAGLIWTEAALALDHPEGLREIVEYATLLDGWDENWSIPRERLEEEVLDAARELLKRRDGLAS
ncbi:hypothetical protein [Streptomyces sp. HNM0574]|uniref:hypothetical protein n=1 Tax=Streptomyces sp. HNM0574 TaxID=2714954 RepID=UPI00146F27DB|nr:hypothetical protein [Streptomyces sp. HNM0574]NLU70063.1 hypothetical protein [Streptomyces sp. HNM0574]